MKNRNLIISGAIILAFSILFFEQSLGKTILSYPGQKVWTLKSWQFMPDHLNYFVAGIGVVMLVWGFYNFVTKRNKF